MSDKIKYELEFPLQPHQTCYISISSASSLSEWYADNVTPEVKSSPFFGMVLKNKLN